MKVNTSKTQLMVVSDALSFHPEATIADRNGQEMKSGPTMKVLGFHMSNRPTVAAHVEAIRKRFRQKYWVLFHLRRNGFSNEDLFKVYWNIIRPVADYCSTVYHAMLTDEQDEVLERCQAHALRCILGKDVKYAKMREAAGVPTLRQRRVDLCDKFAQKCLKNARFAGWFLCKQAARSTRRTAGPPEYLEEFARCDRKKNSPVYYMRRQLNGKEGKEYGERYWDRTSTFD